MRSLLRNQDLIYFRKIDPQKFVCSSDPVGVIMFAFGTLFVDKLIHQAVPTDTAEHQVLQKQLLPFCF